MHLPERIALESKVGRAIAKIALDIPENPTTAQVLIALINAYTRGHADGQEELMLPIVPKGDEHFECEPYSPIDVDMDAAGHAAKDFA